MLTNAVFQLLVAIWETCGSKFDWETTAEIMGGSK